MLDDIALSKDLFSIYNIILLYIEAVPPITIPMFLILPKFDLYSKNLEILLKIRYNFYIG
jgi:hypothetical protein